MFELQSGNQNVNEQMDIKHIKSIDGLVNHNPPNNNNSNYNKVFVKC